MPSMLKFMAGYAGAGVAAMVGLEPIGGGHFSSAGAGQTGSTVHLPSMMPSGRDAFTVAGAKAGMANVRGALPTKMAMGVGVFGASMSAMNVYQGYQEGGIGEAYDRGIVDVAAMSAVSKFAYKASTVKAGVQYAGKHGLKGVMGRSIGAFAGASVGQAIGEATMIPGMGTVGAVAGGAMGTAPVRATGAMAKAVMKSPALMRGAALLGAGAVTALGAGVVMKTGGALLKAGYQHGQQMRAQKARNLGGSMASFATNNAQTMRARAVQAMGRSAYNTRSAMGREANLMHQNSYRSYHSMYRAR